MVEDNFEGKEMVKIYPNGGRAMVAQNRRYDFSQRELAVIVEGLCNLRTHVAIAEAVQKMGCKRKVETIAALIKKHYVSYENGLRGFLMSQGVFDEEIERVAAHYADCEILLAARREVGAVRGANSHEPVHKKPSRPTVEETADGYIRLNGFIKDRVVAKLLPAYIAHEARDELGVSCSERSVLSVFRRYGGVQGFLERWYSKGEAARIAVEYEATRKTLSTIVR